LQYFLEPLKPEDLMRTIRVRGQDHTVVQRLMDHGLIEREDQVAEQLRHALTNVLGGTGKPCSVDVRRIVLADQDKVLLCTDGLTGMVDEVAIANILAAAAPADATCAALIDAALAAFALRRREAASNAKAPAGFEFAVAVVIAAILQPSATPPQGVSAIQ